MQRKLLLAILALGIVAASASFSRAESMSDQKWNVFAEARARWERFENYSDFNDKGATQDAFSFSPYRIRVGVDGHLADNVGVRIELQNFGVWGNQDPQQSGATQFGPNFQTFDGDLVPPGFRSGETSLYQGYVTLDKIGGTEFNASIGRMENNIGTGLIIGNEEFYNGTVFDGVKAGWNGGEWSLNGFYFKTSETGPLDAAHDDHNLDGLVASFGLGEKASWGNLDVYGIGFQDGFKSSTCPPLCFGVGAPHFWTFGGHWWHSVQTKAEAEDNPLDWNLEAAIQTGDVTDELDLDGDGEVDDKLDFGGSILDGSIGWNFAVGDTIHRVSGGLLWLSGDNDTTDSNLDAWVPLFPSNHGRFGNSDFFVSGFGSDYVIGSGPVAFAPGITAYNVAYDFNYDDGKHTGGFRYWTFQPTEDSIDTSLGKVKVEDFGNEWDIWYNYRYTDNVSLFASYSSLSPDDGLTGGAGAPDDSVTRLYAGLRLVVK